MKAFGIRQYGGPDVVEQLELPKPKPEAGEVLIQIHAASVNPVDLKVRNGALKFVLPYRPPFILGNDCSGIITELGAGVTRFKVGDEVYTRPHTERTGTFAEWISVQEHALALMPKNLTLVEAASIPLVGLTAWQALVERGNLQTGQKVFIPAGSGGVGAFTIQLAKYLGAHVATSVSTRNIEFVKKLGADQVIDYTQNDFSSELKDFDLVLDTLGDETQDKGFKILKPGGKLISIVGPPTYQLASELKLNFALKLIFTLLSLKTKWRAKKHKVLYEFLLMKPSGAQLREIATLIENGKIRTVIDRVFSLEQTREALTYCESGKTRGKSVIRVI